MTERVDEWQVDVIVIDGKKEMRSGKCFQLI